MFPTDCLVLTARTLRANGTTEHDLDLMLEVNPGEIIQLTAASRGDALAHLIHR